MIRTLTLLSALLLFSTPAWAIKFSLVGAGNLSTPESTDTNIYSADSDFGGGALLEFGLVPSVGLEFGGLYLPRKYEKKTAFSTVDTKLTMWEFPVLLKAYLADVLSIGFGGYYAKYKNSVEQSTRLGGGAAVTTKDSLRSISHEGADYGIATSLGIYIPFGPAARFIMDGRYNIGVKDNNTGATELKYNDITVLAGFQFGF